MKKDIKILPIFDQSEPNIWGDFLDIRMSAMYHVHGYLMSSYECDYVLNSWASAWKKRAFNFAFGAYDNGKMIGFIQGDCMYNVASIRSLYVLPDYMRLNIGSNLLQSAESACTFGANKFDLISLPKSKGFYKHHNYVPIVSCSNHYIKNITKNMYPRNTVVPIFKLTSVMNVACKDVADKNKNVFDQAYVNKNHCPMFAYVDNNTEIRAFIVCKDYKTNNKDYSLLVHPSNFIQKYISLKLQNTFNNFVLYKEKIISLNNNNSK